jgi:outer membrane receptor protein involved in Fe transport
MALAGGAWAQAAPTSPPAGNNTLQELVVTGSRIPRPNLEQPAPVSVITPTMIQQAGPQNLGDIIAQLPSVGSTATLRANSNNFGNSAGISSIDLRNLGTARTLVLVDGQRHVNGDVGFNAVDLNSIPSQLVDHVEVVTGGASAIYGSDAVSGVVNIIMKKRFEGLQLDAQAGSYDGYGAKYSASATAGKTLLDDRLNVTASLFYNKENTIWVRDVPHAHNYGTITNPADLSGPVDPTFYSSPSAIRNDGIPDNLFVQNLGSDFVTPNLTLVNPNSGAPQFMFDSKGRLIPVAPRSGFNSFAFGQLPQNCQDCYFPEDLNEEASPIETKGGDFRVNFDWTPHLHANLDAKLVQEDVKNLIQPSFTFFDFQLQPDNAFIQPDLRNALAGTAPGDYPLIAEFLQPQGRTQSIRRRTYRVVGGLNGDFDAHFANINWDGELNYGKVENRIIQNDLKITANFDAAMDSVIDPATGQPACRINVPSAGGPALAADETSAAPGCVPFNPFAPGLNSAAAFGYSFGQFETDDTLSQEVASLNANFDTSRFFNLQGGPLGVAVGAEYRQERTKDVNSPALVAGLTEFATNNSSGGYNTKEAYIELSQTVFKDWRPFMQELTLDAAFRGADYSTVGRVGSYKFSGDYAPVSWLKFRSTYSRAIRAPNITEAFEPPTPGFFTVVDPCSQENIGTNTNFAKNCAAAGIPAGFIANTNASILGQSSGNPNLEPEKSISYTGGIVFQPPVVPGLAITLDYYSIKIKNAISQVAAQDVINNCFGSASLDPNFCSLFTRDPVTHNINFVKTTFVNASKLYTDGYEMHVTYTRDVSGLTSRWRYSQGLTGNLTFDMTLNYLDRLRDFPFQNDPQTYHALEGRVTNVASLTAAEGTPHWKGVADATYKQGPVTFNWQVRYVGKGALFNIDPTSADRSEALNDPYAKAVFYHDVSLRYKLDDRFGGWGNGAEVFVGVNDLFGDTPPYQTIGVGSDVAYDLGRFFYTGFTIRR